MLDVLAHITHIEWPSFVLAFAFGVLSGIALVAGYARFWDR